SRSWSSTPTEGSRESSSTIGIHRSAPGGRRTRTEGSGPVVGWPPQVGEGHETVGPPGEEPMSAHHTPEEIRSNLDHPIVDGDGHWVEFDPVFAERLRKVGGDKAADGFLAAMQTTCDALRARS